LAEKAGWLFSFTDGELRIEKLRVLGVGHGMALATE
jgi:hypothetical protein